MLDICPTIAIAAVETGDDLKQLTEILDWQFALYNLSHLPCNETESIVKDVGASIVKEYAQLGKKVNSMNYFHEKRMERQRIQNSVATIQELRNVRLYFVVKLNNCSIIVLDIFFCEV